MFEQFPQEAIRLDDNEAAAVASALEKVTEQRTELAEKDPRQFILGITEGRELLSVDEMYGVDISEERFIVRFSPLDRLVAGEQMQEQRMTYMEVRRIRDGGTTYMPTRFGNIHRPAPHKEAPTTLDGKIVTPLTDAMPNQADTDSQPPQKPIPAAPKHHPVIEKYVESQPSTHTSAAPAINYGQGMMRIKYPR